MDKIATCVRCQGPLPAKPEVRAAGGRPALYCSISCVDAVEAELKAMTPAFSAHKTFYPKK
jgi:hypothetical protein